jgi:hypothetical protein
MAKELVESVIARAAKTLTADDFAAKPRKLVDSRIRRIRYSVKDSISRRFFDEERSAKKNVFEFMREKKKLCVSAPIDEIWICALYWTEVLPIKIRRELLFFVGNRKIITTNTSIVDGRSSDEPTADESTNKPTIRPVDLGLFPSIRDKIIRMQRKVDLGKDLLSILPSVDMNNEGEMVFEDLSLDVFNERLSDLYAAYSIGRVYVPPYGRTPLWKEAKRYMKECGDA